MVPFTTSFEEKDRVKSGGNAHVAVLSAIYRPLCSLGTGGFFIWERWNEIKNVE